MWGVGGVCVLGHWCIGVLVCLCWCIDVGVGVGWVRMLCCTGHQPYVYCTYVCVLHTRPKHFLPTPPTHHPHTIPAYTHNPQALQQLTLEDVLRFRDDMLRTLCIEALVHGNVDHSTALTIVHGVVEVLQAAPLPAQERPVDSVYIVPRGNAHLYRYVLFLLVYVHYVCCLYYMHIICVTCTSSFYCMHACLQNPPLYFTPFILPFVPPLVFHLNPPPI